MQYVIFLSGMMTVWLFPVENCVRNGPKQTTVIYLCLHQMTWSLYSQYRSPSS